MLLLEVNPFQVQHECASDIYMYSTEIVIVHNYMYIGYTLIACLKLKLYIFYINFVGKPLSNKKP